MPPLAAPVRRLFPRRPKPVIVVQVAPSGFLRGSQLCDSWNLATLAPAPTRDVRTLRRAFPEFAFVVVPARSDPAPPEQWDAIGNPAAFLRTY